MDDLPARPTPRKFCLTFPTNSRDSQSGTANLIVLITGRFNPGFDSSLFRKTALLHFSPFYIATL